jgi:hypothetical protein
MITVAPNDHNALVGGRRRRQQIVGPVSRSIIDQEDFQRRGWDRLRAGDGATDELDAVADGDDDAETRGHGLHLVLRSH